MKIHENTCPHNFAGTQRKTDVCESKNSNFRFQDVEFLYVRGKLKNTNIGKKICVLHYIKK